MDFDFDDGGGFDYSPDDYSLSDDLFYAETNDWQESYDSSFDLAGSTTNDESYWDKIWGAANTPLGTGIIGGVANGALTAMAQNDYNDRLKDLQRGKQAVIDKHNKSINNNSPKPKKVTYHGKKE